MHHKDHKHEEGEEHDHDKDCHCEDGAECKDCDDCKCEDGGLESMDDCCGGDCCKAPVN